jgi:putative endonuclease
MADPRHALGVRAEQATGAWLSGSGWRVLARRWRSPSGELDLVCIDPGGALVGVEVKLRRSPRAGRAVEAVDARRVGRMRRSLAAYARELHLAGDLRLDLVSVEPTPSGWRLRRVAGIDAW